MGKNAAKVVLELFVHYIWLLSWRKSFSTWKHHYINKRWMIRVISTAKYKQNHPTSAKGHQGPDQKTNMPQIPSPWGHHGPGQRTNKTTPRYLDVMYRLVQTLMTTRSICKRQYHQQQYFKVPKLRQSIPCSFDCGRKGTWGRAVHAALLAFNLSCCKARTDEWSQSLA